MSSSGATVEDKTKAGHETASANQETVDSWIRACINDGGETTVPENKLEDFQLICLLGKGARYGFKNQPKDNGKRGYRSSVTIENPGGEPPTLTFFIITSDEIEFIELNDDEDAE